MNMELVFADLIVTFISICLFPVIFVSLYPARVSRKAIKYIYWIEAVASYIITNWMLYDIPRYSGSTSVFYMIVWYFVCTEWCKHITEKNSEDTPQSIEKIVVISAIILVLEFIFYFVLHVFIKMIAGSM